MNNCELYELIMANGIYRVLKISEDSNEESTSDLLQIERQVVLTPE